MIIDYDVIPEILIYFIALFSIFYLIYRPYIFSVIDPLFIFILTTAFASVLVLNIVDQFNDIAHFFVCHTFLFLGFSFIQRKYSVVKLLNQDQSKLTDFKSLKLTVYLLLLLFIIGNCVLFFTKGFALLSDTPSNSKVGNFQEGFGIFRKINWAAGGFVTIGLIFIYITSRQRRYLFLLFIVIFFTALEGSKGSLVKILTSFAFLAYHPFFNKHKDILRTLRKYIPIGLAAILLVTFIVLSKENNDNEQVFFAFVRRLLYSGDSIIYYYTPINENYFAHYSMFDYPSYIMNTIMGFLRLAPYKEAFGNIMVENVLPSFAKADVIVGPNTPFYIEGRIFFGYYGAFVHSFIIGAIYSIFRKLYFSFTTGSAFSFVFLCCLCLQSGNILVDTSLFVTILFDTCFWVLPTYIFSCFILDKKMHVKIPRFLKHLIKYSKYDL